MSLPGKTRKLEYIGGGFEPLRVRGSRVQLGVCCKARCRVISCTILKICFYSSTWVVNIQRKNQKKKEKKVYRSSNKIEGNLKDLAFEDGCMILILYKQLKNL